MPSFVRRRTRWTSVRAVQMSHWKRSWSLPCVTATRRPFGDTARFSGIRSLSRNRTSRCSFALATSRYQTELIVGSRSPGPLALPSGRNTTREPCPAISGKNASVIVNTAAPVVASVPITLLPPLAVGRALARMPPLSDR